MSAKAWTLPWVPRKGLKKALAERQGYVDWSRGEISVKEKPSLGFQIKNYERRTVPVVQELMELLREQRKTLPDDA
jgi:hypothetical protein